MTLDAAEFPFHDSRPIAGMATNLTVWSMFSSADLLVKLVMGSLIAASLVTWTVWIAKSLEIVYAKRRLQRALPLLAAARDVEGVHTQHVAKGETVIPALLNAVARETIASRDIPCTDGVKERIASHLGRIEAAAARTIRRGTGALATIGATAPFVGLFGTVWGIMNSFIGISKAQTTNLAVVAPGIAEALLATALGLVAAIPAVIFYNQLTRAIASYRNLVADAVAEIQRLSSRDLDRSQPRRGVSEAAE